MTLSSQLKFDRTQVRVHILSAMNAHERTRKTIAIPSSRRPTRASLALPDDI